MRFPALGLGWCIWRQHRLGISLLTVYMILSAVVIRTIPPDFRPVLATPVVFGLLYLIGIFGNTDQDLVSTRSGYPNYLFTVPVRTRTLILWPMLYGTLSVAATWFTFALLVFTPHLQGVALWCPAAFLVALTANLQALTWYPVPLPYLRAVLSCLILTGLALIGAAGWANGLPTEALCGIYLATVPLAALSAVRGVTLARDGRNRERTWLPERAASLTTSDRFARPFASGAQAQAWLEWKRSGLLLPLITACACCLLLALPLLGQDEPFVPLGIGNIQVQTLQRVFLLGVPQMMLFGTAVGCCPRKAETFRQDLTLQPFLATRPLATVDLVGAKLRMAAWSAVSAWGVFLPFLALWLLEPARSADRTGTIGGFALSYLSVKSCLFMALILALCVGATWKAQIAALWVELTGRRWLAVMASLVIPLCLAIFASLAACVDVRGPAFLARVQYLAPPIGYGLVLIRTCVAGRATLSGDNSIASFL